MFERQSSLQSCLDAGGRDGAVGGRAVRLTEVRGWYLWQLAVFAGRESSLTEALRERMGIDRLPPPQAALETAQGLIFNTAPRQYWVVTPALDLDSACSMALAATDGTATALSHARVRIALEGAGARAVLEQGISVDLHPEHFRIGGVVQTALHHTGVLLHRAGDSRYEMYLLRTFAESLWEWLTDAALPLGYDVGVEQVPGVVGND